MTHRQRPLRFLLLHSETGGGHRQAATAVAEALETEYGQQAEIQLVDALAAYAPWPYQNFPKWYGDLLWDGGRLYGAGYKLLDRRKRARTVSDLSWLQVAPAARRLLTEQSADVVAAFHPLPVHAVSRALARTGSSIPFIGVGTDLIVMHAFWVDPRIRRYLVATEGARRQLLRHGIEPRRIEVTGLPVRRCFVEVTREDPRELRRRLGLHPELPLVLAMGGGMGFGPLKDVVRAVTKDGLPAQMAVITGHNRRLRSQLSGVPWPGPVNVQGFVNNVHEWMQAADVLITKAGPNTIAEALTVGLPIVLWGAIPVQETPNVEFVTQAGAGVWAPEPEHAAQEVRRLLSNSQHMAQARRRARELAQPGAARRVARFLWKTASYTEAGRRGKFTSVKEVPSCRESFVS